MYLPRVFDLYLRTCASWMAWRLNPDAKDVSPPFYAAAWELCRRGVLRPGVCNYRGQETEYVNGYTVMPAGRNGSRTQTSATTFR